MYIKHYNSDLHTTLWTNQNPLEFKMWFISSKNSSNLCPFNFSDCFLVSFLITKFVLAKVKLIVGTIKKHLQTPAFRIKSVHQFAVSCQKVI